MGRLKDFPFRGSMAFKTLIYDIKRAYVVNGKRPPSTKMITHKIAKFMQQKVMNYENF